MKKKIFIIVIVIVIIILFLTLVQYNVRMVSKANAYFDNKDYKTSNIFYNKVFLDVFLNENDLLNISKNKIYLNKKDEALSLLKKLEVKAFKLKDDYFYDEVIKNISHIYYDYGKYQLSLEYLKKLKTIEQNLSNDLELYYIEELIYLALESYNNGDYLKSLECFKYLEENTDIENSEVLYNILNTNLALNYYNLADYKNCVEYFKKRELSNIIELEKSFFVKYINSLNFLGMYDEGLEVIDRYSNKFNDENFNTIIQTEKLFIYINIGNYDEAQIISDFLINKEPNNMEHYINQYTLYRYSHGYEFAQNYLKGLVGKFPPDSKLYEFIKD